MNTAERLRNKNIRVSLAVTADPVPKIHEFILPGRLFYNVANVSAWKNFYQRYDSRPFVGRRISGAQNRQLSKGDINSMDPGNLWVAQTQRQRPHVRTVSYAYPTLRDGIDSLPTEQNRASVFFPWDNPFDIGGGADGLPF